jgi:hypothetical protein
LKDAENPIVAGLENTRPCVRIGPLAPKYWVDVAGGLWRGWGVLLTQIITGSFVARIRTRRPPARAVGGRISYYCLGDRAAGTWYPYGDAPARHIRHPPAVARPTRRTLDFSSTPSAS